MTVVKLLKNGGGGRFAILCKVTHVKSECYFYRMSENGDVDAPKRELSTAERHFGVEAVKAKPAVLNAAYKLIVAPAVWFREKVRPVHHKMNFFNKINAQW